MENTILQIVILVGVFLIYFTTKNLLPSYFNEKGKNIATREDIEEITKMVEAVKQSFVLEVEKIKANLQTLTNIKINLIGQEIDAIIAHNEAYFNWINMLTDTNIAGIDNYNSEELSQYQKSLGIARTKLNNSETRLRLFVENKELLSKAGEANIETIKHLASLPSKFIINIKHNNYEIENCTTHTPAEKRLAKHDELLKKRKEIHETFNKESLEGYKNIISFNRDYQTICRKHIAELMTKQETSV